MATGGGNDDDRATIEGAVFEAAAKQGLTDKAQVKTSKKVEGKSKDDSVTGCKKFYQSQSHQKLGDQSLDVPIWYSDKQDSITIDRISLRYLHQSWLPHLDNAIAVINEAAPGLHLYRELDESKAKIKIYGADGKDDAFTQYNILQHDLVYMCLCDGWPEGERKGTSVHETLHALGFEHEQKRRDAGIYVDTTRGVKHPEWKKWKEQYTHSSCYIGITRFDPYSIMMYPEDRPDRLDCFLTRRENGDTVWTLKPGRKQNEEMSELDKVALNLVYAPCKTEAYQPQLSGKTGLYYCGRKVMDRHNHPHKKLYLSGKCGPDKGPNCPACRTLHTEKIKKIWSSGRWQGWSGYFYCGKELTEKKFCGPDNGQPCADCKSVL